LPRIDSYFSRFGNPKSLLKVQRTEQPCRFRWTLYENGQPRNQSIVSYGTKRDADADATKALDKEIANWRPTR
jgi:hypothetical protein